jgi:ferredoxin-NADP reductase
MRNLPYHDRWRCDVWNLEGLFAEAPFRWAASNIPAAAPILAKLDDMVGNGGLNPVKKWWWDISLFEDGGYKPTLDPVNKRDLQRDLDLKYEDQTLAVYPAPLAPHPWPYPDPMDREKGIAAYHAMITADAYKLKSAKGETDHIHRYVVPNDAPVIAVRVNRVEAMTDDITKYEFTPLDGSMLPTWEAGAHLDIVVAPEMLRQYSMSGDPSDRTKYQIGVLREDEGRGGSALLHRIFSEGRRVFISKPINHFPLVEDAPKIYLMGGGIGVTPMIAFAHRLHDLGRDFALHYSCGSRAAAAYLNDLGQFPWSDKVHLHFSDEDTRAKLDAILTTAPADSHVYTCGPDRYMTAVIAAATQSGFPEDARHLEYFNLPEQPEYENHPFTIKLSNGRTFSVPSDKSVTDILQENDIPIDVKCSDGLCGVCQCGLIAGEVEHRDFVLSAKQRETRIILCQSRAATPNGIVEIDL